MTVRVGINGFGRIGRNFWRAVNAGDGDRGIEIVAANDLGDVATMAHLLQYDSVVGKLPHPVSVDGDTIRVGDKSIKILAERDRPSCRGATWASTSSSSRPGCSPPARRPGRTWTAARRRSSSPPRPRKRTSRS